MSDLGSYRTSTLNLRAIEDSACRAARDTPLPPAPNLCFTDPTSWDAKEVLGPHWALFHRATTRRSIAPLAEDNEYVDDVIALLPDGKLVCARVVQNSLVTGSGSLTYPEEPIVEVRSITEADVEKLDYSVVRRAEPPIDRYEEFGANERVGFWGLDRGPNVDGSVLLSDARGSGLITLLNAISRGASDELPGLAQLHSESIPERVVEHPKGSTHSKVQTKDSIGKAFRLFARRILSSVVIGLAAGLFIALANYIEGDHFFAHGSYVDVALGLVLAPVLGLLIDVFIGIGKRKAFAIGAAIGVGFWLYLLYRSAPWEVVGDALVGRSPVDLSMFWVAPFIGVCTYLLSALYVNRASK